MADTKLSALSAASSVADADLVYVVQSSTSLKGTRAQLMAAALTTAKVTITQVVAATGSPNALVLTGAAHTTLTASTEAIDANINLARTVQFATGALTTQRAMVIQAPTYAFVGASTITTAATLAIAGPPVAGTNATITNKYALWVQSGKVGITKASVGTCEIYVDTDSLNGGDAVFISGVNGRRLYLGDPSNAVFSLNLSYIGSIEGLQTMDLGVGVTSGGNSLIQRPGGSGTDITVAQGAAWTSLGLYANSARLVSLDTNGNVTLGTAAIATNATNGFLYIVSCAGTPTGTPTAFTGRVPVIYDSTNDILYIYRSGWKKATASLISGAVTWQ